MLVDDDAGITRILRTSKTIAVVGASPKQSRDSRVIFHFLQEQGYTVFPVNPRYAEIDGQRCYSTLLELPGPIDIVDVFRRPGDLDPIVDDAIAVGAHVLWCQLGVVNTEATGHAIHAGMDVVVDRCIAIEYRRLMQ